MKSSQSIYGLRQVKKRSCEIVSKLSFKEIIFIMRYISVLGLVLKARVFGSW